MVALNESLSLRGKRALITGAASGIGLAIAGRFAEAGAGLELLDLDAEALTQAAASLEALGAKTHTHVLDLADKDAIDTFWAALKDAPDILVNNAGVYPFKPFTEVTPEAYEMLLAVNLHAVAFMCQHFLRRRARAGGVIINIGSIEALLPFKEDLAVYSLSKAGVIALTRALAREHAQHGFRINALVPGGIVTAGTKAAAKQVLRLNFGLLKTAYDFQQRLPAKRLGQPDEVAKMALVLASDLSSYVHGAVIPVDGGFLSS